MFRIMSKIFLSKRERQLGDNLLKSGVSGVTVTERGSIIVDSRVIMLSEEFKELKKISSIIIKRGKM